MKAVRGIGLVTALLVCCSCGGEGTDLDGSVADDGASEEFTDSGTDSTPDVEPDVAPDAAPDAEPDVEPDGEPDVAPDVAPDGGPDTEPDGGPDVPWDVDFDGRPDRPDFGGDIDWDSWEGWDGSLPDVDLDASPEASFDTGTPCNRRDCMMQCRDAGYTVGVCGTGSVCNCY